MSITKPKTPNKIIDNGDYNIYNTIPDTNNILSQLVNNIKNNDGFQKHFNKINQSIDPIQKRKADILTNTMDNIKVFNTKVSPLFLAKDIGILLGISNINMLTRKFDEYEKIIGYIKTDIYKIKKVIFLTQAGIYRCFYTSRSPLAKMFRKFISTLINHMITEETEILKKVSNKFNIENPELIEKGINDMNEKMIEYEKKYKEEKIKYDELKKETTQIEILNSYKNMHITTLENEKLDYINRINNIRNEPSNDIDSENNAMELKILKEKFMKPAYIYILHPVYFKKLLLNKKKLENPEIKPTSTKTTPTKATPVKAKIDPDIDDIDDKEIISDSINPLKSESITSILKDFPTYEKNYYNIFSDKNDDNKVKIENDEILYYYINFSRDISKKDKFIYVGTQWINTKKHYNNIIKSLIETCNILDLNKILLFNTSLDDINDTFREELLLI